MNSAQHLAPNTWDVQFMMGDLNYRLDTGGGTTKLSTFCYRICSQRNVLFAADSLAKDPTLGTGNTNGWVFPEPCAGAPGNALYFPTYKKFYKGTAGANAQAAAMQLPANPDTNVPLVYDLKTDKDGYVKEGSREGQYDLGWLDRVGYRVSWAMNRTVNHVYSGSPVDAILSDHAPVYSIFDVT